MIILKTVGMLSDEEIVQYKEDYISLYLDNKEDFNESDFEMFLHENSISNLEDEIVFLEEQIEKQYSDKNISFITILDLGRWNGRFPARTKIVSSIKELIYTTFASFDNYSLSNEDGKLTFEASDHDGTSYGELMMVEDYDFHNDTIDNALDDYINRRGLDCKYIHSIDIEL